MLGHIANYGSVKMLPQGVPWRCWWLDSSPLWLKFPLSRSPMPSRCFLMPQDGRRFFQLPLEGKQAWQLQVCGVSALFRTTSLQKLVSPSASESTLHPYPPVSLSPPIVSHRIGIRWDPSLRLASRWVARFAAEDLLRKDLSRSFFQVTERLVQLIQDLVNFLFLQDEPGPVANPLEGAAVAEVYICPPRNFLASWKAMSAWRKRKLRRLCASRSSTFSASLSSLPWSTRTSVARTSILIAAAFMSSWASRRPRM